MLASSVSLGLFDAEIGPLDQFCPGRAGAGSHPCSVLTPSSPSRIAFIAKAAEWLADRVV